MVHKKKRNSPFVQLQGDDTLALVFDQRIVNRKTKWKEERKIERKARFADTRVRANKESGKTDGKRKKQWKLKPAEKKWLALEAAFLVDCRPVYLTRVLTRIVRRGSWHLGHAHPKAFSKVLRALHCGVFTTTAAHGRQDRDVGRSLESRLYGQRRLGKKMEGRGRVKEG